jgi:hypothetical protein
LRQTVAATMLAWPVVAAAKRTSVCAVSVRPTSARVARPSRTSTAGSAASDREHLAQFGGEAEAHGGQLREWRRRRSAGPTGDPLGG